VASQKVLAIDVGGSHVKFVLSGDGPERRRFASGPKLTASEMVEGVVQATDDWTYGKVSIGVPAPVRGGQVVADPVNLGKGWAGFDFEKAFGLPTKIINDAAMQALGSYEGGKMLFLGLGTGLGSALVIEGITEPLELGHLPFRKSIFEDYVGEEGRKRLGKKKWLAAVDETIERLTAALQPDYVVLGGGNAKKLVDLPPNCRLGANADAFRGAFRLWDQAYSSAIRPSRKRRSASERTSSSARS
jgi:polyphosphate glucokinase